MLKEGVQRVIPEKMNELGDKMDVVTFINTYRKLMICPCSCKMLLY